jgi:hypothetical protein
MHHSFRSARSNTRARALLQSTGQYEYNNTENAALRNATQKKSTDEVTPTIQIPRNQKAVPRKRLRTLFVGDVFNVTAPSMDASYI